MPYVESYQEFVERHGGALAKVAPGVWLAPSGASVMNQGLGPVCREPPNDLEACIHAQMEYHSVKFGTATRAFSALKAALTGATDQAGAGLRYQWPEADFGPAPSKDGRTALLWLREIATQHQTALTDLDRQLEALPGRQADRDRERERASVAAQASAQTARDRAAIEGVCL